MRTHLTVMNGTEVVEVVPLSYSWDEIRRVRNRQLARTDWRAMKDRTLSTAWKEYRSALRDLPQNHDTPSDAVEHWPVMPDE